MLAHLSKRFRAALTFLHKEATGLPVSLGLPAREAA